MPDIWMDVDVALAEVPVNILPLLDDGDFKTIESSVVYNAAGMALFWNFVTTAGAMTCVAVTPTSGGDYDWTDQGSSGTYAIEMPASGGASANNDTEGVGWFTGSATGVLPWRGPTIGFRAAALNNSLIDAGTTGLLAPTTAARTLNVSAGGVADADMTAVSTDSTAADRLETMLDGTGGNTLSLGNLAIVSASGTAVTITGQGAGAGALITGGGTSGIGVSIVGGATNGKGLRVAGAGSGTGFEAVGGATGAGTTITGGATSGAGIVVSTTSGRGLDINSADTYGVLIQGTTAGVAISGTTDGINIVSAGDGVEITAGGTGAGINVTGGVTSGAGISVTGGATGGKGIVVTGTGTGDGVEINAGVTGIGLDIHGGGTSGDAFSATTAGSGLPLNAATVDEIWDEVMEGTVTARQSVRLANSANASKLSGAATTTVVIRDVSDTKDRITATVDASGNRTAVTTDVT